MFDKHPWPVMQPGVEDLPATNQGCVCYPGCLEKVQNVFWAELRYEPMFKMVWNCPHVQFIFVIIMVDLTAPYFKLILYKMLNAVDIVWGVRYCKGHICASFCTTNMHGGHTTINTINSTALSLPPTQRVHGRVGEASERLHTLSSSCSKFFSQEMYLSEIYWLHLMSCAEMLTVDCTN